MKIYAGRADDIRRERDEWDSVRDAAQKRYDEQHDQYQDAKDALLDPIRDEVMGQLSKYDALEFDVQVEDSYRSGIRIRVQANQNRVHDESSALSWDYSAMLLDGEVKKESGSWSGLSATTPDQMNSLKQTVAALEYLNSVDWAGILDVALPNWEDYVTEHVPRNRPNFEQQIKEAEIEDYIGSGKLLRSDNPNGRGKGWITILSQTPKKYKYVYLSDYEIGRGSLGTTLSEIEEVGQTRWNDQRWKEEVVSWIDSPIKVMEESDVKDLVKE